MEKLKKVLSEAGASMDSVIKATVYLVDLEDRQRYLNDIWREYFPSNPPCRTALQVALFADARVEIEMVAVKK